MTPMPPRTTDWVFLDLDGCLVDSSTAIPAAMNAALQDVGLPTLPASTIVPLIGPPLELFAVQLVEQAGGSPRLAEPFARAYLRRYRDLMVKDSRVYEGIPAALSHLAERARLAVVTLKRHELAESLLTGLGLDAHLDFIVGSVGTEADKAPLLKRAVQRAAPTRAVMVGDQPDDMIAARRLLMPALGVAWGFGSRSALTKAGAAAIVGEPSGLAVAAHRILDGQD
jgi:phosphoglycolate phosphatase